MGTFFRSSPQLLVAVSDSQLCWAARHHFPVPVFILYSSLVTFFAVRCFSSNFYITVLVLLLWSFLWCNLSHPFAFRETISLSSKQVNRVY